MFQPKQVIQFLGLPLCRGSRDLGHVTRSQIQDYLTWRYKQMENTNEHSITGCEQFGKLHRAKILLKTCNECKDSFNCNEIRDKKISIKDEPTEIKQPSKPTALKRRKQSVEKPADPVKPDDRKEMAVALKIRQEEQAEREKLYKLDDIFDPFDEFRENVRNFIFQEIPSEAENPDYQQFKRADELKKLLRREFRYVEKIAESFKIRTDFKWSAWNKTELDLKPKKDERKKKVSKIFQDIYSLLWRNSKKITYQKTKELYEKHKLPFHDDNYHVLAIPDLEKMAGELETTVDNIRKQIRKWCDGDSGPVKIVGWTTRKRDGGKQIYSLGCWLDNGIKRNPFFIKEAYNQWLRNVYFKEVFSPRKLKKEFDRNAVEFLKMKHGDYPDHEQKERLENYTERQKMLEKILEKMPAKMSEKVRPIGPSYLDLAEILIK